jgi:hypothetical protein
MAISGIFEKEMLDFLRNLIAEELSHTSLNSDSKYALPREIRKIPIRGRVW